MKARSRVALMAGAATATLALGVLGAGGQAMADHGHVTVDPQVLDFGALPVGDTSEPQSLTFTNHVSADVQVTGSAVGGAGDFAVSPSSTCAFAGGEELRVVVRADEPCTVDIVFVPARAGSHELDVEWVDAETSDVIGQTRLTGEGIGEDPAAPPAPTCAPPAGPVSGPLHTLGVQLGPLGAGMVSLAQQLCAAGL